MAKKKNKKETTIGVLLAVARKVEREDYVAALREGRKKVTNKKACRDSRYW
jgi:hypothetical protein